MIPRPKQASDWVGRKPDDSRPIVYHGCHESDARRLMQAGIKNFCLTYYDVERAGKGNVLDKHPAFSPEARVFLDSGAFSFLVKGYNDKVSRQDIIQQVRPYIERYAAWVKAHPRQFDFYVTFDYLVEAPVVYEITHELQKLGIRPVPVYHGDDNLDWVRRYIDEGHRLIGLSKRFFLNDRSGLMRYYDQVFRLTEKQGVACHGFAATGAEAWRYPFYCMTDEHTILTKRGWLGRDQVRRGDFVLTFRDGISEWKPILKIHQFQVVNTTIRRFQGRFSSATTLNHRWRIWRVQPGDQGCWEWCDTEDFKHPYRVPRRAEYANAPFLQSHRDTLIRLVAWVWTDGSLSQKKATHTPRVIIYQSLRANPKKVQHIRSLLKSAGASFCEGPVGKTGEHYFEIGGEVRKQIAQILGVPKTLTFDFILSLTKLQLQIFIDEALLGDGCRNKAIKTGPPTIDMSQKRGPSLEAFKLACVLAGFPISSFPGAGRTDHVVTSNIPFHSPLSCRHTDSSFSGFIWCVEVENHTFFTRCQNSYYWTGNSVDSTSLVKNAGNGMIWYTDDRGLEHKLSITTATHVSGDLKEMLTNRGLTLDEVRTQRYSRVLFNALSLQEFLTKRKPTTWNHKTLF